MHHHPRGDPQQGAPYPHLRAEGAVRLGRAKIAPLAEVKDRLSAYIDAARESAIVVTRNGMPVALLTPILEDDDLDSLLLTHDRKFMRLLARARKGAHRSLPEQRAVLAGAAAPADATGDDTDVAPVAEGEPLSQTICLTSASAFRHRVREEGQAPGSLTRGGGRTGSFVRRRRAWEADGHRAGRRRRDAAGCGPVQL
ncbi:MAG: hypothetical protein DMD86_03065, partial [Candidatus Rokuibacteriota bacterium]